APPIGYPPSIFGGRRPASTCVWSRRPGSCPRSTPAWPIAKPASARSAPASSIPLVPASTRRWPRSSRIDVSDRSFRIGIDTGGTFTDVVALDEATGEVFSTKTPTTVHDPSLGVLESILKVLSLAGGGRVVSVSHGTTVATNALLQEQFPALGLVT